jgi:hypothetical protein
MEQELEPTQHLLAAAAHKQPQLVGTQKAVPVDMPDDLAIAGCKHYRGNLSGASETRKSFLYLCLHGAIIPRRAVFR